MAADVPFVVEHDYSLSIDPRTDNWLLRCPCGHLEWDVPTYVAGRLRGEAHARKAGAR